MNLTNFKTQRGITMLEIVISLFIIGIAATIASTMIISTLQSNRTNKNKLVAISLAREGIEAVRNIRDSNWLRYKANLDECWNFWENPENSTYSCPLDGSGRIQPGYYKANIGRFDLPIDPSDGSPYTYKWYLSTSSLSSGIDDANFTTPSSLSDAQLWYVDLNPSEDGNDQDLNVTNDIESSVYTAYSTYNNWNTKLNLTNPPFYRQIQISYPNDKDDNITSDLEDATLQVTSVVVWFEKGKKKKVKFMSRLSNYME